MALEARICLCCVRAQPGGKLNYASKEIVVIFNRLARRGPDSSLERSRFPKLCEEKQP